jgi:transcriptional regulator with XRE-family HTH domain
MRAAGAGELVRRWRERRRLSQLELSNLASVSARHLSFVETGRSQPSREVLLHLADRLDVPLRERNALLLAAGYAPLYRETPFDAPQWAEVRDAVRRLLEAYHPYPALVVDGRWNLLEANDAAAVLVAGVDPALLEPPLNVLRLGLHPDGLPRLATNAVEFSLHLLARLERQVELNADAGLAALLEEVRGYLPGRPPSVALAAGEEIVTVLDLSTAVGPVRLFTTIATIGTPLDITAAEVAIETFLPADPLSASRLHELAGLRHEAPAPAGVS